MRFLAAALALLLVGIANAEIQLSYPEFIKDKTVKYDVWINTTSGIPGMHPQVSKSAVNLELNVHQTKETGVHYMSMQKLRVSNSVPSVGSKTEPIKMEPNTDLEEQLKIPTKFTYNNGRVESYTIDPHEGLESISIRKSILRLIDIRLKKEYLQSSQKLKFPLSYNLTSTSPTGNFSSHIVITSSPFPFFPKDHNVINITRTDNYESIPYMTYHTHHNYAEQGCPGVCKKDPVYNQYSAGCPVDRQPHQNLMTQLHVVKHFLRKFGSSNTFGYDIIESKETHVADVYDQNMAAEITIYLRHKHTSSTPISVPTGQRTYKDLNDYHGESKEDEINRHCKHTTSKDALNLAKKLLDEITSIVHKSSIDGEAKHMGEKLVKLQKAISLLKYSSLERIQTDDIVSHEDLPKASEEEKIKRQIWLDNLPLAGTPDTVSFIISLIKKSINEKYNGIISLWECKSLLEALPLNLVNPTCKTIQALTEILEELRDRTVPGYGMYYSAVHMSVARAIRKMYDIYAIHSEEGTTPNYLQKLLKETDDDHKYSKCIQTEAQKFIKDVKHKLKESSDRLKTVILIDVLSQTGLPQAIPILKSYVEGHISGYTPSYTDFLRSVALNALHNLVKKNPQQVRDIVFPVYTNQTEAPKLRTAAFGVFIKSSPTLGNLQHVAVQSWSESSYEVGSFVSSSMQTFANSTNPCDQLTASRIHKVWSQFKQFPYGKHHAQSVVQTIYDNLRGFGIQHRFSYTPSNESFVPSSVYASLGYNTASLTDYYFKFAINSQGFNSLNLWDNMLRTLKLKVADDIPKAKESQIFDEVKIAPRANEFWRFTYYLKICGADSFYYMDDEEYQKGDFISFMRQHFGNYLTFDRNGDIHGHIVKVCMPSSYQAKTFARSLSFPITFDMRNPLVLSLKVNIKVRGDGASAKVEPSFYYSTQISHEILNIGDCKQVGVYHERDLATSYPVQFDLKVGKEGGNISYTFPDLPKKVLRYHSESGTQTKRHVLEIKSSSTERRPIKHIPHQFERNNTFGFIGLPVFESHIRTEDIAFGHEEIPRNTDEAVYQVVKELLNAGWRRKTIEVYRKSDPHLWDKKSKVTVSCEHSHKFVTTEGHQRSDENLVDASDITGDDEKNYEREEHKINANFLKVSHLQDSLKIYVEQKVNDQVSHTARLSVMHNRTLEGLLHSLYVRGNVTVFGVSLGAVAKFVTMFTDKPNEFNYDVEHFGKQNAVAIGIIKSDADKKQPHIAAKVHLSHEPLEKYLNKELASALPSEYYYPDTHEECLKDKRAGKAHSTACIKATRERAIYNKLRLNLIWNKDIPHVVEDILSKLELAVKHAFFKHLSISKRHSHGHHRRMEIEGRYINKLTSNPVYDIEVKTPKEKMTFQKVDLSTVLPISSISSIPETYIQRYTNNTYPATCTLMKSYVRTYDLRTIRLPRDKSCSYILTTHCVRRKKFAVIVKIDTENPKSREVHLYIGKRSMVLTPPKESKFEIKYEGKPYTVQYLTPVMLHEADKIYAVVSILSDGSHSLEVHAETTGIRVTYDGQHVMTQVHPRYKGELCGLCSEFNGEVYSELRGPNRCLFSHEDDYAASSALGSCYSGKATHQSICSNTDYEQSDVKDQDDHDDKDKEYAPVSKRNHVYPKGDKICFAKVPTPVCSSRDEPKERETRKLPYHCLPKTDNHVRVLIKDAKIRILGELETKPTDFEKDVDYPKLCVKQ